MRAREKEIMSGVEVDWMGIFIVEFDLKSRFPTTVESGDVIVDKGYSTVTVRNVQAGSDDEAENKARVKAEAFLNELSWRHEINLEIGSGLTIAPQDSPITRHIKYLNLNEGGFKGGHRKKFPRMIKEVVAKPSDSKALYRKAQISQDPRDKFRELFLAIENVASKIVKDWDSAKELKLIKTALQRCFSSKLQELEHFICQYGFEYKGDIIDELASDLYVNYRLQLFHAKANRGKKIPFNLEDQRKVERILPLAQFVASSMISYEDDHLLC